MQPDEQPSSRWATRFDRLSDLRRTCYSLANPIQPTFRHPVTTPCGPERPHEMTKPVSVKPPREGCSLSADQDAFHRQPSEDWTGRCPKVPSSHDVHHDEHAHHLGSGGLLNTHYHTPPADFCSTTRPASTPASFRTSPLRMNGKAPRDLAGGDHNSRCRHLTTSPESRPRHPLSPFGGATSWN